MIRKSEYGLCYNAAPNRRSIAGKAAVIASEAIQS